MKKLQWVALLLLIPTFIFASDGMDKLDVRLKMLMRKSNQGQLQFSKGSSLAKAANKKYLDVFVRGNADIIKPEIESAGGYVNTVVGDILTAKIPIDVILDIAELSAVKKIKLAVPVKIKNDEAIKNVNADKVHSGTSPLQTGCTGKGVIVGIIDSGIDWDHEDFRDPADQTKSRVLSIWDQLDNTGTKPAGFSYGSEWTKAQIEDEIDGTPAGVVKHKDSNPDAGGHGTHVSGTAGGNKGIAYDADLIVVGLDFAASTGVLDAANYIYQKAAALGRPAVINASIGSHAGTHDGTSAESQGLDILVSAAPGRVFCAAAGNEGADFIHYGGFTLQDTPNWTYYYKEPFSESIGVVQVYAIVDNNDLNTISFSIGADSTAFDDNYNPIPQKKFAQTEWKTVQEYKDNPLDQIVVYGNGQEAGKISIEASVAGDNTTALFIYIEDNVILDADGYVESGLELWRFYAKGSSSFHAWTEGVTSIPDPASKGITVDGNYKPTDNKYSVGMPGDANKVITVGAYVNRSTYIDVNGVTQQTGVTTGELGAFSSRGPTRDGRLKPEIVAPGQNVVSALSTDVPTEGLQVAQGGKHQNMTGTSMATPVTTGAVALLLEKDPALTNDQVRTALFDYTLKDNFTSSGGALPNNDWGYGKLDIFAVTTETGTLIEDNNRNIPGKFILSQNYPNPFNPTTTINFSIPKHTFVELTITNILGKKVKTLVSKKLTPSVYKYEFDGSQLASGVYLYMLKTKEFTQVKKMLLVK